MVNIWYSCKFSKSSLHIIAHYVYRWQSIGIKIVQWFIDAFCTWPTRCTSKISGDMTVYFHWTFEGENSRKYKPL